MISSKIKNVRGISLISLVIAITVLMILSNVIIYNVKNDLKLGNLTEMQNDIVNLRDKVSSYYRQNGEIPANIAYTNINHIKEAGVISEAVDTGDFLVIDLSALENLTLNKGKDFEKVKGNPDNVNAYTDLYIINETSHNVFYVAGVTINQDTFYTDYTSEKVDTATVNLKYIENVKIPDGFYYVEGTKDTGIKIKSNDNTEEYQWIQETREISGVPNDIEINTNQKEDFIKSVNGYHGYYKSVNSNKVIFLGLENWSPIYDKEGIYRDKNGDTAYIPQGFSVSETPGENTIDEGLVVRDEKQNEWVWIEVPKSIYQTAQSSEDYEKIEKDMQTYTSSYRNSDYTDTWNSKEQHGFASADEYNNWKKNMLKSVYEKEGFYIGRYEVGTTTARASSSDTETTPIIQKDAYPYNFVTCKQAQILAKSLATGGKTSSLMFGIQWDLVMKYVETKGGKTQDELKDSTTWGNYSNATFDITRGEYSATEGLWNKVNAKYTKPAKGVMLTTGATQRNHTLNIYDLSGNVWEWILEYTASSNGSCVSIGGASDNNGKEWPAFSRNYGYGVTFTHPVLGFRPVLY